MNFSAAYEEEIDGLDYTHKAESDSLQWLLYTLRLMGANDYHMIITEWDLEDTDEYGPNELSSARMFEIEPWMDDLESFQV